MGGDARKGWDVFPVTGLAAIFVCVVFIGFGLNRVYIFLDIPSVVIVFGIMAGILLMGMGERGFMLAWKRILCGAVYSEYEAAIVLEFCRLAIWGAILGGVLGTLIGMINMLGGVGSWDCSPSKSGAAGSPGWSKSPASTTTPSPSPGGNSKPDSPMRR